MSFFSYLQIGQVEVEWWKEVFILPDGGVGRVGVRKGGFREGRIKEGGNRGYVQCFKVQAKTGHGGVCEGLTQNNFIHSEIWFG